MVIKFLDSFVLELDDIIEYYDEWEQGEEFHGKVLLLLNKIQNFPRLCRQIAHNARRCVLRMNKYSFSIIYRIDNHTIYVDSITHDSRKPKYRY